MDCIVHGVEKSQTRLSNLTFTFMLLRYICSTPFQGFYLSLFLRDRLSVYFQSKHFFFKEMTQNVVKYVFNTCLHVRICLYA